MAPRTVVNALSATVGMNPVAVPIVPMTVLPLERRGIRLPSAVVVAHQTRAVLLPVTQGRRASVLRVAWIPMRPITAHRLVGTTGPVLTASLLTSMAWTSVVLYPSRAAGTDSVAGVLTLTLI